MVIIYLSNMFEAVTCEIIHIDHATWITDYIGQTDYEYGRSATLMCDTGYVTDLGSETVIVNCTQHRNWSENVVCKRMEIVHLYQSNAVQLINLQISM